jgi:tRNA nucleotidyltransferase (CCA-adding enzyme)
VDKVQVDLRHPEFQAAIPILKQIEDAGFEAYFVGGCVRDALLGLPIHDVDIATSAYPQEVKQIFKRTVDTGIQHGTVTVLDHGHGYEITTFRTESGYQDFRRPDQVTFVRSLKEDQLRRDFTINALAARHDGSIIDNFGGLQDLDAHLLRAVGNAHDRFHEDALRMMRAVRFESQLGFQLETQTAQALRDNAPLLEHIATERIATEFIRMLLGIKRSAGLTSFIQSRLYLYCPGLADAQDALLRYEALDDRQLQQDAAAWTLLVYLADVPAAGFMKKWKQANHLSMTVQSAQKILPALLAGTADNWALFQCGEPALTAALEAAALLNPAFDQLAVRNDYAALSIKSAKELALNGGDLIKLGFQPGREMGQTLASMVRAVVAGTVANDRDALLATIKH